jgi:hypothetical protein
MLNLWVCHSLNFWRCKGNTFFWIMQIFWGV